MSMLEKGALMTNAKMANWFGVSEAAYIRRRKQKLEELALFADFEYIPYKGVYIKEVYYPEYSKNQDRFTEKAKDTVDKTHTGHSLISYSSNSYWAMQASDTVPDKPKPYRGSTQLKSLHDTVVSSIRYRNKITSKISKELYGDPRQRMNDRTGSKGWCEYIWCRGIKGDYVCEEFDFMDEEDIEFADKCWDDFTNNRKTKAVMRRTYEILAEDEEFNAEEVLETMKTEYDSVFKDVVYDRMREYFSHKYNRPWIYVRAILLHDWDEETEDMILYDN